MSLWSLSLPFFVLSATLGVALTRWMPGGAARPGASSAAILLHRAALLLLLVLPWALAGAVAWTLERSVSGTVSRTWLFYTALTTTVAPQLLLHIVLARVLFRRNCFTGSQVPMERVRVGARVAMAVVVSAAVSFLVLFLVLSPDPYASAPVAGVLIAALAAGLAAGRWSDYARHSRPVEMEDNALRREVLAVAASFGWAPRGVRIYSVCREDLNAGKPREEEILKGLDNWRTDFNPMRPDLPLELVQETDAAAVTAGMAMRYAHGILLNPLRLPAVRLGALRLPGAVLAAAALALPGLAVYGVLVTLGEGPLEAAILAYWAVVLLLFAGSLAAIRMRRRRYHCDAFRAWRQADPAANRSPEDFVAALARYDRAMKHVADPEVLLDRLGRDQGLMRFLKSCGPGAAERAFQAARRSL